MPTIKEQLNAAEQAYASFIAELHSFVPPLYLSQSQINEHRAHLEKHMVALAREIDRLEQ